jgi:transposase
MPEPGEVLTAYREVGGTTALARHYGVPRHTATGWLRRLRSQGLLEA